MLKNLKKVAAIVLSFAMAVQFGLADSYYVNAVEESVEPQQEEITTTTPQEQEEVPTTEEETPQQQEEDASAAEETNEQAAPETKSVELSYVAEDGTVLHETASRDFNVDYSLKTDSSVMLNFDGYTLKDVIINNSQTVPADQANLSVTSDLVSVKFVYVSVNTKEDKQTSENNEQTKTEEASEDDAEADPETKEELPEYPAFDQSETAGNVVVHATAAEGVLPRDSKLVVKRITRKAILNAVEDTVSEKNKEMDSAVALDITIQNKDGVEIQPNGSVNISFENAAVSGDEINVYHVTDDASAVTEVATNTQSFDANHFSIYVITGEKEKPLTTFNFVDANGKPVSTQIVKTGDTLITPTAPDVAGKAFVGWYDGETKFEDFNTALTITETKTRTITAKYEDALYVYFYNPAGTQIMRTEKVGDHEGHDFTNISYEVDATHKIVGWADKKNGTTNIADSITVPTDKTSVNVYAIIKEGYWISFDSDGGSIVDSQFVLNGDTLTLGKDTTPTKPGYTFDGWYNGLSKVENGATVASSMTLTAHWKAAEVSYTVIHWWENADDNGYSFHESENKTGRTGTEANAKAKSYEGFKAQPVTKKTIKGDGSTIVSVYYKRNVYEVRFYSYSTGGFLRPGKPSKEYEDLRITAKYGQDISKKWPTYKGSSTWRTNDGSGAYQVNIGTMPLGGATFYGPKTGDEYETAYYYVEALPGEASDVTVSGIRYKLDHKDTSPGQGYYVTKEDQYPLTGFTFNKNSSTRIEGDYDNARFYYTRNTYKIKFINKGKEDKSVEKKYEQSISSENYTPTRPSSLPDYYEFDGWYDNELCEGKAFDFNGKKMPAQNVTLYAKWTAKKINLTYNLNNPEGDVVKGTKKVEAGTIANTVLPSASEIKGYSFAGWYYADGNGKITKDVFNANDAILRDTNVIGKWLYNGKLTVKYVADGVEAPKDNNVYAGGAKATVANGVTKDGKKFLGWKLKGSLYYPGDAFEVNKNLANEDNVITLTAVWGSEEHSTTMSYDPGNGRGDKKNFAVKNNESVTLKSEKDSDLGYQAPKAEDKEYYFAGWATSMDDANNGKATYAAGQTVHVDVNGENVLYATWVEKTVITLFANSNTVPYTGQMQEVNGFVSLTIDGYTVSGLNAHAQGTDVGTYPTEITGTAHVEKDNQNVTNKVIVKTTPGQLTINKAGTMTLTPELTGKDAEKVYDGQPLSGGATATVKEGTKITYSTDGGETWSETLPSITDVGTLNVTAKAENKNYEDVTVDYTLTVKHRKVTVTGNNGNKVYGEADPELTATVAGTVGKDKVKYTVAREAGEDVGHYSVIPTGEEIQGNYKVTYVAGTLTITSQSIDPGTDPEKPNPDYTGAKVNSPKDSVYDGKEHKWIPTVTDKADKKLEAGKDYTVEYSTKNFKDVGTIKVTITGIGNYSGTVKRSYKVTPKEYTVTTESATKTYSGTALTAGGKVEGIVSGETVEFTTTGSQTEVGTSKNTYELVWKSAKATNYTLVKESIGKLTVKAKSIVPDDKDTPESEKTGITVNEPSDSKYDGKEHKEVLTVTDTKTGKELVAGTDYSVTYSSDLVNAGTVKVTVAGLGNYTESFTKTYKITKRSVTLTSATVSKVYDGSALTNTSITVSGDGFVEGEGASYEVTGTQTEVGNSANAFEYKLNEKTLASNYNITKVVGTLTITAAPAPVTPATPSTPSTPSTTPRTPSAPQVTTPVETVEKETTPKAEPKKEEKVEEEYTPKASPQYYWALINLICAILTVLFGLLLLISKRHKSEDDDEEDDDETKQQTADDDESKEQEKKRGLFTRVLAVLIAIVSVVFFLVTEDLSLPWTWTDQWTIWMVVIGLVQIVVFFVGRKWKNVDDDEDEEEAQQA